MFMISGRWGIAQASLGLLNLVAEDGGLFKIFGLNGLAQFLLQGLQAVAQVPALSKRLRDFADVPCAFMHGFEQAFQGLGKGAIALRASQAARFFEIGLGEAATGAFELNASA
jgi:hypothetical protein